MKPTNSTYLFSIAIFVFLLEIIYSYKEDKHLYNRRDTINNICIGLVTYITQAFSKLLVFYALQLAFQYHIVNFGSSCWIWVLAFLGSELTFYWFHRASHTISWFWASHVVHHSSAEYNLSVAIRLPWFPQLTGKFLFWIWMPLLGFHPIMIIFIMQMQDFYQGFLHTKTVRQLPGIIEYIFNTPSHHRVHHSSNFEYLDKNYSAVIILFDRIFGTFRKETSIPSFGLTDKIKSDHITGIMFHEWIDLFRKASKAGSFKSAINYFIKPPGWSHDGSSRTVAQMRKLNSSPAVKLSGNTLLPFQLKTSFCLAILIGLLSSFAVKSQDNWVLNKETNGIKIFTRKTEGFKVNELKVECTLEGKLSQLAAIIFDMDGHTQWVYRSSTCYLLKTISATDVIFYNETKCPWPLDNRDVIAHLTLVQDPKNKTIIIEAKEMDSYLPVKNNIVRMKYSDAIWKVTPIDGKWLNVEYRIQVDPAGAIPAWILNLFASKGPYETFMKLREILKVTPTQKTSAFEMLD
jgi:sterol desaturase/sphingolipid hydroxylase (fatty acid hydroxylase superfamily)